MAKVEDAPSSMVQKMDKIYRTLIWLILFVKRHSQFEREPIHGIGAQNLQGLLGGYYL